MKSTRPNQYISDDNKDNAFAAGELGFNAIHFLSADQLRVGLRALGLKV